MAAAAAFGFHPHSHSNFLPNGHSLTPFQFESKWIDPNRPENDIKPSNQWQSCWVSLLIGADQVDA